MLNRSKIFAQIEKLSNSIFFDYSDELKIAAKAWQNIIDDKDFSNKILQMKSPLILPTWQESIDQTFQIKNKINDYCVVSVDGSQIYPDRHQGTSCFLINIGSVVINYGINKNIKFDSIPFLFDSINNESADIVDCKRQELEFKFGLEYLIENNSLNKHVVFLFDGSLIFWHLESKSKDLAQEYLSKYLGLLHQFYKNDLLIAGFISLPKSKELINLIRIKLLEDLEEQNKNNIDHIVDTNIANFYLKPFERTILFKNNSPICLNYPEHLRPYFFYLNIGVEIVRIEIPSWIAQQSNKIDLILQIIIDQCKKGFGYPIVLAEAHEQAVIKGADRDYFYQILHKLSVKNKQQILISQKSSKKRMMGI